MKLLLFIVIFCGVLTASWIYFLPTILTSALQKRTGFGVKVTELYFNPFNAKVDLTGLILTNPESFPRPDFIEVRSFSANAKLKTLFSDRPEFDYARVDVAYVAFVCSADGVLNTKLFNDRLNPPPPLTPEEKAEKEKSTKPAPFEPDAMATKGGPVSLAKAQKKNAPQEAKALVAKDKGGKDQDVAAAKEPEAHEKPLEQPVRFLINRLEVSLEKVIVADYTTPTPTVREFNRKLFYTYNNVTEPKQLLAPFTLKGLESVGAAIKGLIPGYIGKTLEAVTKSNDDNPVKKTNVPAEAPLKTVIEKLEETPKP